MIEWLYIQTLSLSMLLLILMLSSPFLNKHVGAKTTYWLWFSVPGAIVMSVCVLFISPQNISALQQMTYFVGAKLNHAPPQYLIDLSTIGLTIWGFGCLAVLGSIALRYVSYGKSLKRCALDKVQQANGPVIYMTQQSVSPHLFGIVKPAIILPFDFKERYSNDQQELIIQHELGHWQQRDTIWNMVSVLVLAVFWFNPLCWLGIKHFRYQQELACDHRVLATASLRERQQYALAMIKASVGQQQRFTDISLSTFYGKSMNIQSRIQQLKLHKPNSALAKSVLLIGACASISFSQLVLANTASDSGRLFTAEQLVLISQESPQYPEHASKDGIEGLVKLSYNIEKDGSVSGVKVIDSQPKGVFDRSAKKAFRKWRYEPVSEVKTNQVVVIGFTLDAEDENGNTDDTITRSSLGTGDSLEN
ncbi:TonB family protein [Glaciecola siphonariae]|uniref:Protein TonB n=1 Tax=Glaciecola siphonariae TaxID=521012 RepID=A0ABV9LUY9_9ALTE